ncbi:hypothetical protein GINT2_000800 [Glugoides intestinalis]
MEEVYRKLQFRDIVPITIISQRYFEDTFRISKAIIDFLYDPNHSFVCENQNKIVGFITAEVKDNAVEITALCVEKKYSRRGIGKNLLNFCLEAIEYTDVVIMVSKNNQMAKKLYESVGFEVESVEKKAYIDESDGYIMKLKKKDPFNI